MSKRKSRSRDPNRIPRQPTGDYEVGYGRPPKGKQWGPGQSGNPLGRKPKVLTMWDKLDEALNLPIIVEDRHGRKRKTKETHEDRIYRRLANDSAKGDPRQTANLIKVMLLREQARSQEQTPTRPDHLPPTRDQLAAHAMMESYLAAKLEGRAALLPPSVWDLK